MWIGGLVDVEGWDGELDGLYGKVFVRVVGRVFGRIFVRGDGDLRKGDRAMINE